jgi:predicted outer membrane protein
MRKYLHDAAAIAALLALAFAIYAHLNPTSQPAHQPQAVPLYAGR